MSPGTEWRELIIPVFAMTIVVAASNFFVQFPVEYFGLAELFTWGAFTYPVSFFVTELTNRRFGPAAARRVVYVGFTLAVILSIWLATPRIALASGCAFLLAQLLDVTIFDRLRNQAWWQAPLASSAMGSVLDTALFFSLAFAGTGIGTAFYGIGALSIELPIWLGWAIGDLGVKLAVSLVLLLPFRLLRGLIPARETVERSRSARTGKA